MKKTRLAGRSTPAGLLAGHGFEDVADSSAGLHDASATRWTGSSRENRNIVGADDMLRVCVWLDIRLSYVFLISFAAEAASTSSKKLIYDNGRGIIGQEPRYPRYSEFVNIECVPKTQLPSLSYRWTVAKPGKAETNIDDQNPKKLYFPLLSSGSKRRLTIVNVGDGDVGRYTCYMSSKSSGTVITVPISVDLKVYTIQQYCNIVTCYNVPTTAQTFHSLSSTSSPTPNQVTQSPRYIQVFSANDKVQRGDNILVHCNLINSQNDPCAHGGKAIWFLNSSALYNNDRIKTFPNNTLQVLAIFLAETGSYECRWQCRHGNIADTGHFYIQVRNPIMIVPVKELKFVTSQLQAMWLNDNEPKTVTENRLTVAYVSNKKLKTHSIILPIAQQTAELGTLFPQHVNELLSHLVLVTVTITDPSGWQRSTNITVQLPSVLQVNNITSQTTTSSSSINLRWRLSTKTGFHVIGLLVEANPTDCLHVNPPKVPAIRLHPSTSQYTFWHLSMNCQWTFFFVVQTSSGLSFTSLHTFTPAGLKGSEPGNYSTMIDIITFWEGQAPCNHDEWTIPLIQQATNELQLACNLTTHSAQLSRVFRESLSGRSCSAANAVQYSVRHQASISFPVYLQTNLLTKLHGCLLEGTYYWSGLTYGWVLKNTCVQPHTGRAGVHTCRLPSGGSSTIIEQRNDTESDSSVDSDWQIAAFVLLAMCSIILVLLITAYLVHRIRTQQERRKASESEDFNCKTSGSHDLPWKNINIQNVPERSTTAQRFFGKTTENQNLSDFQADGPLSSPISIGSCAEWSV